MTSRARRAPHCVADLKVNAGKKFDLSPFVAAVVAVVAVAECGDCETAESRRKFLEAEGGECASAETCKEPRVRQN